MKDFILVNISNINWNDDLTPWKIKSFFKNDNDYYGLVGYSLAGLFSLYSSFNTNIFTRICCISASFGILIL